MDRQLGLSGPVLPQIPLVVAREPAGESVAKEPVNHQADQPLGLSGRPFRQRKRKRVVIEAEGESVQVRARRRKRQKRTG